MVYDQAYRVMHNTQMLQAGRTFFAAFNISARILATSSIFPRSRSDADSRESISNCHKGDTMRNTAITLIICASLAALTVADSASAQSYPSRTVRLVVPFPPGGGTDAIARILGSPKRSANRS
jgi:hypothetical protein